MIKPKFSDMTRQELRSYILEHRHDDEAIAALINKGNSNSPTDRFPQTEDDCAKWKQCSSKS